MTEPNIACTVLVFVHLVMKWIPCFYSSLFLLCSQFLLNLNVIREMFQVQFQYTDYAQLAQTQLLGLSSTWRFWTWNSRQAESINVLYSYISLTLFHNPVWSLSNCKMTWILSLSLFDRFGLRVEFHQFFLLLDSNRHLHRISLVLCLHAYIFYVWKKKFRLAFSNLD